MCDCVNIAMGSYDNQFGIKPPFKDYEVGIDKCILAEIIMLWGEGVITIECCCGHNTTDGYIAVKEESIQLMKSLDYKNIRNPSSPESEQFFKPKSI